MFFNLLTGNFLFDGDTIEEILAKNMLCDLSHVKDQLEGISKDCYDLLFKMIDPNPETRLSAEQALNHQWFKLD